MLFRSLAPLLTVTTLLLIAPSGEAAGGGASLLERLKSDRLQRVRQDTARLRAAARPEPKSGDYLDVRTAFHVHSRLSHDSRGTPEEILAAAKQVGIRALFMTEHPTPDRKWLTEQVRGERDGVLVIPGAELSDGLLGFRSEGVEWPPEIKSASLLEKLGAAGGIGILAHPEQRTEWDLPPFAGMEIYNTHADAEDNPADAGLLRKMNVFQALQLLNAFRQYPVEAFAAIFDPPLGNLKTWDGLTARRHVTGIAGNDSHANVGIQARAVNGKILLSDPLGKKIAELDQKTVPPFILGVSAYKEGETLLDVRFDPYRVSLGYVTTHLLADGVTEDALFEAIVKGRAYVAFDWVADPSGFSFTGEAEGRRAEMGGELSLGARLSVRTSLAGTIRLLRDGVEVSRCAGRELVATADQAGAYRVEVCLPVGGEQRPWIYSNPIYSR